MKKSYVALALVGVIAVGYFIYRKTKSPEFRITQYDSANHKGSYIFDGVENPFGNGTGITQGGKNGYTLDVNMTSDNKTKFDLFKNGVFQKTYGIY